MFSVLIARTFPLRLYSLPSHRDRTVKSIRKMPRTPRLPEKDAAVPPAPSEIAMAVDITVLLADDHAPARRGFRCMLEDDATITVVGEATNGIDVVQMACQLAPSVVLMDCALPCMDGVAATRRIVESSPATAVLMLSMHSEANLICRARDAGARGYILKNALDVDLISAVKRVAAGELPFDPPVLDRSTASSGNQRLTMRELEILPTDRGWKIHPGKLPRCRDSA